VGEHRRGIKKHHKVLKEFKDPNIQHAQSISFTDLKGGQNCNTHFIPGRNREGKDFSQDYSKTVSEMNSCPSLLDIPVSLNIQHIKGFGKSF